MVSNSKRVLGDDESSGATDNPKLVRFESTREVRSGPRVAARFEDGVLETYFPGEDEETPGCPSKMTQQVQTERSTRDCGFSASKTGSLTSLSLDRCTGKKDVRNLTEALGMAHFLDGILREGDFHARGEFYGPSWANDL
jgi:hypothetical protein